MSKSKWVWTALAVVVVFVGLASAGVFGSIFGGQQAAVVMSQTQTQGALSSMMIQSDAAKIYGQILIASTPLPSSPTKAQIANTAVAINLLSASVQKFGTKLQSISSNAKSSGSAVPDPRVLADMLTQVANAGSQASAATKNAMATSSSVATIQVSVAQIQTAQAILGNVRADIQTLLLGLGIK
jgi:hypothetical protein